MIIATPLDIPKIEPDDWDLFWEIWNKHSGALTKNFLNQGSAVSPENAPKVWIGLDMFDRWAGGSAWQAPVFEAEHLFPKMFKTIFDLNLPSLYRVRFITSLMPIPAHSDDQADRWNIRAFIHHPSTENQWYFTKPNDRQGERKYLRLPEDTNWFAYNDKYSWHGTDYDPSKPKILMQLYSKYVVTDDDLIQRSFAKYKDYGVELE